MGNGILGSSIITKYSDQRERDKLEIAKLKFQITALQNRLRDLGELDESELNSRTVFAVQEAHGKQNREMRDVPETEVRSLRKDVHSELNRDSGNDSLSKAPGVDQ